MCTPRADKKWGSNLQGKVVSAPSQAESAPSQAEQEFKLGDLDGGRGYLDSSIARVLRATTKEVVNLKMSLTFWRRKVHPGQNPGYAYGWGVNVGSVIMIDPTRTYTRTRSLSVLLPLGIPGKSMIGIWLWLDVGLWESPVPM